MDIEQKRASFCGLGLATTRQDMLAAMADALAEASAARLPLLAACSTKFLPTVVVSGGLRGGLAAILHRDWPPGLHFRAIHEATVRGLGRLTPTE